MSNIYIHETHTIYAENNELHLVSNSHHIVINIDTFIHDLPAIVSLCTKEHKKTNKELYKRLKQSLK